MKEFMKIFLHTDTPLSELKHPTASRRNPQLFLAVAAFLFFSAAMLSMIYLRKAEESLSSRIAPDVLRFHVLANSDSSADQELKLQVKQMLIDTIYADLKSVSEPLGASLSKEVMINYIEDHREELEETAENFMNKKGFPYSASVRVEASYFPTKIYGDMVFPCGTYDAVRVLLGKGDGKNWWCVLYPPLCFTDNATAVVPDSSKGELKNLLDDDDFYALMNNRRVVFGDNTSFDRSHKNPDADKQVTVHVRSRFLDLFMESASPEITIH